MVPEDDPVILEWRGLRVTFRLARLWCLFMLSVGTLTGCFWIILAPTNAQAEQVASNIAVAVVTAWITVMTSQTSRR